MTNLHVAYQDISELKAYPANARTHSKKQIRQIAASIEKFGFTNPKGRKKGSISLEEVIVKELLSKVKIREGDKEHKVTKLAALIKSRVNAAIKSDRHAFADIMKMLERAGIDMQKAAEAMDLSAEDALILELFKKQSEAGHES